MTKREQETVKLVAWPYDPAAAKTITCYEVKAPRAKLYIWRKSSGPDESMRWSYTLSAGADSERSHTDIVDGVGITPPVAAERAIQQCKDNRSWEV